MKIYILVFEIGCEYEETATIIHVGTDFDETAKIGDDYEKLLTDKKENFQDFWIEVWEDGKCIETINP